MSEPVSSGRGIQDRAVLGVVFMLLGMALYPISDAFVKHLMGTYAVSQTIFLRSLTRICPLLIAVLMQGGFKKILATSQYRLHALRLGVNLAYTYAFMFAFSAASLTSIYTLSYASPFFMILLSSILLKEKAGKEKWLAVFVGLIGVLIAVRPGSGLFEVAALTVLFACFLGALNKILMRRLAITEHSLAIATYPNIVMILATFPFLVFSWQPMPLHHWICFFIVGLLTAAGQYAIAQALRFAQGSTLAPIDYSGFFWVVALDFVWWENAPDLYTICGALVIVCSNLYIVYKSRKEAALFKPIL
jgi:drug/metabolite transporter (DMT)-like permease